MEKETVPSRRDCRRRVTRRSVQSAATFPLRSVLRVAYCASVLMLCSADLRVTGLSLAHLMHMVD